MSYIILPFFCPLLIILLQTPDDNTDIHSVCDSSSVFVAVVKFKQSTCETQIILDQGKTKEKDNNVFLFVLKFKFGVKIGHPKSRDLNDPVQGPPEV